MKSIKRFFWITLFVLLAGTGTYYPLTRHVVIYQSSLFLVPKAGMTFYNTYLNLDKHPEQWCVVHNSSTLYNHFYKHHFMSTMRTKISCAAKSTAHGMWKKVKTGVQTGVSDGIKWVKRETPKQLKNLKKTAIEGANYLKKQAKKSMKNLQK